MQPSHAMRETLRRGFVINGVAHPWGTLLEELVADAERTAGAGGPVPQAGTPVTVLTMDTTSDFFGIATSRVMVWAPNRNRPVVWMSFDLPAGCGYDGPPGLVTLRAFFEAALGPVCPGTSKLTRGEFLPFNNGYEWDIGDTTRLSVSTMEKPQTYGTRVSAGSIRVERDQASLMAPFLADKLDTPRPWALTPGEVEVIDAPGLVTPAPEPTANAIAAHDDLHPTPEWVAARLEPEQAALWSHEGGHVWGIGNRVVSRVFSASSAPIVTLQRGLKSRGEGWAAIGPLVSAPGPAGLDRVAQRLVARGVRVRVEQHPDE